MREKIARASLVYDLPHVDSWNLAGECCRKDYLHRADAAIEALLEPTPAMKAAAAKVVGNYDLAHEAFVQAIRAAKEGK